MLKQTGYSIHDMILQKVFDARQSRPNLLQEILFINSMHKSTKILQSTARHVP